MIRRPPRSTLFSLHDALPISQVSTAWTLLWSKFTFRQTYRFHRLSNGFDLFNYEKCGKLSRSEEHTSELQSRPHLVCRLLLQKKKMSDPNCSGFYLPCRQR